ncbi:MAG: hypothetical protein ABIK92_04740 [Pseudomonadota bacterium]
MFNNFKKLTISLLIFCLIIIPSASFATLENGSATGEKGPNALEYTLDLLIARPIGIVLVPVGAVIFAVAYPFTLIDDSTDKAYDALLGQNIDYTFKRSLGEDLPLS